MTKHYTELTGASAERIQYGIQRFNAKEIFSACPPVAKIGLTAYEIEQISSVSVFIRVPKDAATTAFDDEPLPLSLVQGGRVLIERDVLRPSLLSGTLYECRFADQAIDIEALVKANATVAAQTISVPQVTPVEVPAEYKIFCADVLDFLGTIRRELNAEIEQLAEELDGEELAALDREIQEAYEPQWRDILRRGNELALQWGQDEKLLAKIKAYTENVVTPSVCASPIWERAYVKPLGYPGDFMIMNGIYDHAIVGETVYMRLLGALGFISANPVALRMRSFKDLLIDFREQHADQDHFHMMSIGAGSAREVREFFRDGHADGAGYSFTLVDTETMALDCALKSIYSSVRTGLSSVIVSGMNTSFTEMLRPTSTFRHLPQQDFIYSSGLTDYLNDRLTHNLVKKLYDHLKPGGSVVIGNINNSVEGMYWAAECVLDWTMYFRTQEDMERIAEGLPGDISISLDQSGSYYLLSVTKPA